MKKSIILISVLIMILSMATVNAFLFWPDTIDCEEFSVEIPEEWEIPSGYHEYHTDKVHSISITTGLVEVGEHYLNLDLATVPINDLPNDNMNIVENYTEGDLKVMKCQVFDDYYYNGDNITYAEFDKEGKHFYLVIDMLSF